MSCVDKMAVGDDFGSSIYFLFYRPRSLCFGLSVGFALVWLMARIQNSEWKNSKLVLILRTAPSYLQKFIDDFVSAQYSLLRFYFSHAFTFLSCPSILFTYYKDHLTVMKPQRARGRTKHKLLASIAKWCGIKKRTRAPCPCIRWIANLNCLQVSLTSFLGLANLAS